MNQLLLDIIVFVVLDVASLIIQSIGGSQASHAAQTDQDPNPGGKIMLYGIVMQMSESPLPSSIKNPTDRHP